MNPLVTAIQKQDLAAVRYVLLTTSVTGDAILAAAALKSIKIAVIVINHSKVSDYDDQKFLAVIEMSNQATNAALINVIKSHQSSREKALEVSAKTDNIQFVKALLAHVNPKKDTLEAALTACRCLKWDIFDLIISKSRGLASHARVAKAAISTGDPRFVCTLLSTSGARLDFDLMIRYAVDYEYPEIAQQIADKTQMRLYQQTVLAVAAKHYAPLLDSILTKIDYDMDRCWLSMIYLLDEATILVFIKHSSDIGSFANLILPRVCNQGFEEVFVAIQPYLHHDHDFVNLANHQSKKINELLIQLLNPDYRSVLAATYMCTRYTCIGVAIAPLVSRLPAHYSMNTISAYSKILMNTPTNKHTKYPPDELIWGVIDTPSKTRWMNELNPSIREAWLTRIAGTAFADRINSFISPPYHWMAALRCYKPL